MCLNTIDATKSFGVSSKTTKYPASHGLQLHLGREELGVRLVPPWGAAKLLRKKATTPLTVKPQNPGQFGRKNWVDIWLVVSAVSNLPKKLYVPSIGIVIPRRRWKKNKIMTSANQTCFWCFFPWVFGVLFAFRGSKRHESLLCCGSKSPSGL